MSRNNIQQEKRNIIMLQETKCGEVAMEIIIGKLVWRYDQVICLYSRGSGGELIILWDPHSIRINEFITT